MSRLQDMTQRKVPIHITVDMPLLGQIDETAGRLGRTRSDFVRQMIVDGLARQHGAMPKPRVETVSVAGRVFHYTVQRDGTWWGGLVEELPGCWSQGKTLAELREMVADAIEGVLIVRGEIPESATNTSAV